MHAISTALESLLVITRPKYAQHGLAVLFSGKVGKL